MVELSVVVPVYRCEDCLRALHARLSETAAGAASSHELIFVDDRSPDGVWPILSELAASDPAVRVLRLSRNFGQHAAITAGLAESRGSYVVVMDCDLQDPPELIPDLLARAREGHDVVLTRRRRRVQALGRRIAGAVYFGLRKLLLGGTLDTNMPTFSLISRKVADAFLSLRDRDRQYLLILEWLGFDHTVVEIDQDPRYAGRSSYDLRALLRVAADGMFFQSTKLLRWVVYAGFLAAALGMTLLAYALYVLISGEPLPDWTALPMLILLLSGFVVVSGGVVGLYVGKIFEQVKGRPLYVVDVRVEDGVERAGVRDLSEYARGHDGVAEEEQEPAGSDLPA